MPAYQSLSGQLTALPALPQTKPGFAYHWPASLSGAIAYITKNLFPITTDQKAGVDAFAANLYKEFED